MEFSGLEVKCDCRERMIVGEMNLLLGQVWVNLKYVGLT